MQATQLREILYLQFSPDYLVNDAGDKEACFVERFGEFGAGTDAHGREWEADAHEEGTFFGGEPLSHTTAKAFFCKTVIIMET